MGAKPFYYVALGPTGAAESGALVYAYVKGTSTPQNAWTDSSLSTLADNPYEADAAGHILLYLSESLEYTVVVKSADDATTLLSVDITTATGSSGSATAATVAAMKALSAGTIDPGTKISTLGYSTAGIGAATYRVLSGSATSNGLTANDGTVVQNTAGDRTFVIDQPGPVHVAWFGALSDGTTDESDHMDRAIATGRDVAIPVGKTTYVGTGTSLTALVSGQSIVSESPSHVPNATLKIAQSIPVGALATRSDDNSIGSGVEVLSEGEIAVIDRIYSRNFLIAKGASVPNCHQLAKDGNASAAGGSYILHIEGDVSQRKPTVTLTGISGTFTATETVTAPSGATAKVDSYDAASGVLTLTQMKATSFVNAELVTGGSSGATGTVSASYRPAHLVDVINGVGDFKSSATVEGAYDILANGLHVTGNAHVRYDEVRTEKYFGRFGNAIHAEDARVVNVHNNGDNEGCMNATFYCVVTSSTTRPTGEVGFANFYGEYKASVLEGGEASAVFSLARSGVECENIDIEIRTVDEHVVHGARVICSAGEINAPKITISGSMIPATADQYGVDLQQSGSGVINAIDIDTTISHQGGTALGAAVNVVGSDITGRIRKPVTSGTVTRKIKFDSTPSRYLRFDVSKSDIPISGGVERSEPFYLENIPTGENTTYLKRGGLVESWTLDRDIRIVRAFAEYSSAPTADELDFIIEIDAAVDSTDTNDGSTYQAVNLWPTNTIIATRGEVVKLRVDGSASYATSGVDVVAYFEYIPLWNDV